MKTKANIQAKAIEIFAQLSPDQRRALLFGTYPQEHLSKLKAEGFTNGEEASVAFSLLELNSLGTENKHDGTLPMTELEAKLVATAREIAKLRRELGVRAPVSQGTLHEERRWDWAMIRLDKILAEVDGVPYVKEEIAPVRFTNIRGLHHRMGG